MRHNEFLALLTDISEPAETGTSDRLLQTRPLHNHSTQGPVAGPSGTAHNSENDLNTVSQPSVASPVADMSSILQIVCPRSVSGLPVLTARHRCNPCKIRLGIYRQKCNGSLPKFPALISCALR